MRRGGPRPAQVEHEGTKVKTIMSENLSRLLRTDESRVNVKARTHEKVDSVGRCEAIECHVVLTLERQPDAPPPDPPPVEV